MANLTLEEMRKVIDEGGSVLLPPNIRGSEGARVLATKHEHLPTEGALAIHSADPDKIAAAEEVLQERVKALQLEIAALHQPVAPPPHVAPHVEPAKPVPNIFTPPTPAPAVGPGPHSPAPVAPVKPTPAPPEVKK